MVLVYADESGTGGIPKNGREPAPGICGFMATSEMWGKFIPLWKAMLAKHNAPYFHFRELNPTDRLRTANPFYNWNSDRVDDFIYDMAFVASTGPIGFGGNVSVKRVHGNSPTPENLNETYRRVFKVFFEDFELQIKKCFPHERGEIFFFFDENDNKNWISILNSEMELARKRNPRIGRYSSVVDTEENGIPCQAADLFAYVNRQNNETIYEKDIYVPQRILDIIVSRQAYPDWHPFSALKRMDDAEWKKLIDELRGLKKAFEMRHYLAGAKGKPQYYPIIEHPYFRNLNLLCGKHKRRYPKLWV